MCIKQGCWIWVIYVLFMLPFLTSMVLLLWQNGYVKSPVLFIPTNFTFCRILVAKDYLFSGSYDRTARCWSVDKEKQIQEFRGHRNCVLTLAHYSSRDVLEEEEEEEEEEEKVSRDLLVTGSTDCTVKVWWVSSGRCYQTLLGHTGAVLCLILDAPNRELFSGSTDYTIRTWNIVTGEQLKVFKEHQGSVICLEVRTEASSRAIRKECPYPNSCIVFSFLKKLFWNRL